MARCTRTPTTARVPYAVNVTVVDSTGASDTASFAVSVSNAAPVATVASPAAWSAFTVGSSVSVVVAFTDAGVNDSHTCSINWGDGTSSAGTVSKSASGATCSATRAYSVAGSYTIIATVRDNAGAVATSGVSITVKKKNGNFASLSLSGGETISAEPLALVVRASWTPRWTSPTVRPPAMGAKGAAKPKKKSAGKPKARADRRLGYNPRAFDPR